MGHLFADDEVQNELYQKSLFHRKQIKTAGIIGGVGIGVGMLGIAATGNTSRRSGSISASTSVYLFSMIGLQTAAVIGMIAGSRYKAKKKELFRLYNESHATSLLQDVDSPSYSFSASNTGLGIVLHF